MDNLKRSVCVLLSAVFITFVSAQNLKDGCMVLDGMNKTTLERDLTLLVAEPLSMDLRVMVMGVQQNSSIENWPGNNSSLAPQRWTPATIQLYPQLRLSVQGHPTLSGKRLSSREDTGPLRIIMENIQFMTNCPEGKSIWKLSADESLGFHLGDRENFTIIANEYVSLHINFDRIKHILCMTDGKPILKESRYICPGEGRSVKVHLNLRITLSDTEYQILGNGHKLKNQKWNKDRFNEIKFIAKADMASDIYVVHPLPLTVEPTHQNTAGPTAAIVALTVVVVVLVALLCLALVFFLRNSPLLFEWKLWQRSHQGCTSQHGVAHEEVPVAAASKDKVKRTPVPDPLQHTTKPWPKTQVGYTAEEPENISQNDYDTNYIVAKDVKPIEVEVLRQQNVIRGQIYHQSPTWSAPAAQYNAKHNPASRQQSADTNYSHTSTLNGDEDSIYLNMAQGDNAQRDSSTSELYDTVYNTDY